MNVTKKSKRRYIYMGIFIGIVGTLSTQIVLYRFSDIAGMFDPNTKQYTFYFHNISALQEGAPVKQSGLEIGNVKSIKIVSKEEAIKGKRVVVDVSLNDMAEVSSDSLAVIQSLGMMGEKYLDISFGSAELAENGARLEGDGLYNIDRHRTQFIHYDDSTMGLSHKLPLVDSKIEARVVFPNGLPKSGSVKRNKYKFGGIIEYDYENYFVNNDEFDEFLSNKRMIWKKTNE